MNPYFFLAVFIFSSQVIGLASASDSLHTGFWKKYTPKGNAFKCQGVTAKRKMENVLKEAGWQSGFPYIDWNKNEAVIIAPEKYYENKEMVFYGLFREKNSLVLDYGWKELPNDRSTQRQRDGSETYTSFSSLPNEPSTIVVSFPKKLRGNNKFYCSERSR